MKNRKQKTSKKPQPVKKQRLWEADWWMEDSEPVEPTLRFSPTAWAKLLYFRDQSDNEVGGFGITDPDDLLFVQDVVAVKQEVTSISVKFDDEAVSTFFDEQVDLGRRPEQFARVWLHTHPADSPEPSDKDEETFKRVFGACQWAAMVIVAQDDSTYARLSFNVGPGTGIAPSTDVFHIGRQYSHLDDRYFRGAIDDVRVYDRALSAEEVAGLAGLTVARHKSF